MNMKLQLKGVISALLTPFENGKVDFVSLEKLIHYQLKNGINGFVVNGTTAESPTLHWSEVEEIFKCVKRIAGSQVPILVGTGSNSTEHTISMTQKAHDLGADAALVVVPYYNKPPQRGLVQHFSAVANSTELPIVLYNVPGRTITSLNSDSILELAQNKNIVGIKEASGDIKFNGLLNQNLPKDFSKLSGDDGTYIPFLKIGGDGIISVMSNLIPAACARWTELSRQEKWIELDADFKKHEGFINGIYVEANPIVPKWMLYKMGIFKTADMRLPLVPLESQFHEATLQLMKEISLI